VDLHVYRITGFALALVGTEPRSGSAGRKARTSALGRQRCCEIIPNFSSSAIAKATFAHRKDWAPTIPRYRVSVFPF